MSKILLTGSNGFLGQHLAKESSNKDQLQITGWSKSKSNHNYCDSFEQTDLCSDEKWENKIEGYDAVIHTAALSQVDYCEENRQEAFLINTEATRRIALSCAEQDIPLIYLSTDFVFDGEQNIYNENSKTNPVNYYGRTKEFAEKYIQNIHTNAVIIRPVLIFGNILSGTRNNLVLWVKNSLSKKKNIHVVTDHYRTATYVKDLADLCLQAALKPQPGIYHACGSSYLSVYEMACIVAQHYNLNQELIHPVKSTDLNAPGKRPPSTRFEASKATGQFGFISRSFTNALEQMSGE